MRRPSSFFSDTAVTALRQVVVAISSLCASVVLARGLGVEGNGVYAMAVLVPTLMSAALNLGVGPANVYFVGRGSLSAGNARKLTQSLWVPLAILASLLAAAVIWFFGDILFPQIDRRYLLIGLGAFPPLLGFQMSVTIFHGQRRFKTFNILQLIISVGLLLAVGGLYLLNFLSVRQATVAYVVVVWLAFLSVAVLLFRESDDNNSEDAKAVSLRTMMDYGWKSHLSNVITFVNYRTDLFLVNFFVGPAAAGIYVIAIKITEKLWMVPQAVAVSALPRLVQHYRRSPEVRARLLGIVVLVGGGSVMAGALLY